MTRGNELTWRATRAFVVTVKMGHDGRYLDILRAVYPLWIVLHRNVTSMQKDGKRQREGNDGHGSVHLSRVDSGQRTGLRLVCRRWQKLKGGILGII